MPRGLNRTNLNTTGTSYRNGSPVTLPINFGTALIIPHDFGNDVTWSPDPSHFGSAVTIPHVFGNVIGSSTPVTYSISGTISGSGGAGATVVLSGASSGTTTADGSGNYSFAGLSSGAYVITPSNTGFVFTPANQSEILSGNITGVNFSSAAAIAFVASAVNTYPSHIATMDTTGATLLVGIVSSYGAGTSTLITDSLGNTWVPLTELVAGSTNRTRMSYCYSPTVGVGHTFTTTGTFPGIAVFAFSGITGGTVDSNQTGGLNSPAQPGSITPSAGAIVLSGFGSNGTIASVSVDSGFTGLIEQASPSLETLAGAYLLNAANSPLNPIWTATASDTMQCVIASFS